MNDAKYQLKIEKEKTNRLLAEKLLQGTLSNPVVVYAAIYLLTDQLVRHEQMKNDSGIVLVTSAAAISLATALAPAIPSLAQAGGDVVKNLLAAAPLAIP